MASVRTSQNQVAELPNEFTNCQPVEMAEDVQKLWKVASHT